MSLMPIVIPGRPFTTFAAGNQSEADLLTLLRTMAGSKAVTTPTAGGTLTINSQALGSYDYVIKHGDQTVSSFTASDWFTATEDSRSAFIVVIGDLTIDAAQVFRPGVRKLFTALYVTGSLTINGEISMSQRGANHSASGSNITGVALRLATGTFDSVTNPQVPATGAGGGSAQAAGSGQTLNGAAGTAGTAGQTGGGGSGGTISTGGTSTSGAGATGSPFGGGPGGGAARRGTTGAAGDGAAAGGAGGAGSHTTGSGAGGGAGNPGGSGAGGGTAGSNGTGGVLFIAVKGSLLGNGVISAAGAAGGPGDASGAGGSGGGSITVMCGTDGFSGTHSAAGGAGGTGAALGGAGGDGTARILEAI